MTPTITTKIETPHWFPTEVREAIEVVWRATLDAFDWHTAFDVLGLPRPHAAETERAAKQVETACYLYLEARVGEHLDRDVASELVHAQAWASHFVPVRPLTVCYGMAQRRAEGLGRLFLDGRDGCGIVYRGGVRGRHLTHDFKYRCAPYCDRCWGTRTRRWERQEAEVRATYSGFHQYPFFRRGASGLPEPTGEKVRVGRCKCGAEVVTTKLRQRRCDDCMRGHC